MKKKFLAVFMAIAVAVSMMPTLAVAAEIQEVGPIKASANWSALYKMIKVGDSIPAIYYDEDMKDYNGSLTLDNDNAGIIGEYWAYKVPSGDYAGEWYPVLLDENGEMDDNPIFKEGIEYGIAYKIGPKTGYDLSSFEESDLTVEGASIDFFELTEDECVCFEFIVPLGKISKEKPVKTKFIAKGVASKTSIKYTWGKVKGASKYKVYFNDCGDKNPKYIKTTKSTSYTKKGLNTMTAYKAYVVAYNKSGKKITKSPLIHNLTTGSNMANATKVTAKKSATVTKGKTCKVNAKIAKKDCKKPLFWKNHSSAAIRYFSADKSIATVTSKGVVKAKKAGVVNIYAVAASGAYAVTKVTVKPAVEMVTVSFSKESNIEATFTTSGGKDVTNKTISVPKGCTVEYGGTPESNCQTITFKNGNTIYEVITVTANQGFGWGSTISGPISGGEDFRASEIPV